MKTKNKDTAEKEEEFNVGQQLHVMAFGNSFNHHQLKYGHYEIVKINQKSVGLKAIKSIGTTWSTYSPWAKESLKKWAMFPTLQEAIDWCYPIMCKREKTWKDDIKGYTPKHPNWDRFTLLIKQTSEVKKLLKDYSYEKHIEINDKYSKLYNELEKEKK